MWSYLIKRTFSNLWSIYQIEQPSFHSDQIPFGFIFVSNFNRFTKLQLFFLRFVINYSFLQTSSKFRLYKQNINLPIPKINLLYFYGITTSVWKWILILMQSSLLIGFELIILYEMDCGKRFISIFRANNSYHLKLLI